MGGNTLEEVMRLQEPPVYDLMGSFKDVRVPVSKTGYPAHYVTSDTEYLKAQNQTEHNDLLNTFYPYRAEMPNWKELGIEEEAKSPHFNDEDEEIRKDLGVKSSVVEDITYNPDTNQAKVRLRNKWYTYNATPEQFERFIGEGSLGRALNRISNNHGSMYKSGNRGIPSFNSIFGGI